MTSWRSVPGKGAKVGPHSGWWPSALTCPRHPLSPPPPTGQLGPGWESRGSWKGLGCSSGSRGRQGPSFRHTWAMLSVVSMWATIWLYWGDGCHPGQAGTCGPTPVRAPPAWRGRPGQGIFPPASASLLLQRKFWPCLPTSLLPPAAPRQAAHPPWRPGGLSSPPGAPPWAGPPCPSSAAYSTCASRLGPGSWRP